MSHRTLDGAFFNEIANHPDVRPWIGGAGEVDLRRVVANPENVAMRYLGGGLIFERLADGLYEAHSMFLPERRGRYAVVCMRHALQYLFTATDCLEILTRVPDGNKAADGFARLAGGRELYRLEHDPKMGGAAVSVRSLTLDAWRAASPDCLAAGEEFHDILERAGEHDGHPEEPAHDRAVGSAVLMIRAGNYAKAVWSYNRWAVMAGYQPVELASHAPVIISMGKAFVAMLDGRIEVMKCPLQQ